MRAAPNADLLLAVANRFAALWRRTAPDSPKQTRQRKPLDHIAAELTTLEAVLGHWIRIVGVGIDVFGVIIIVIGLVWSTMGFLNQAARESRYDQYRVRVGRTLLLGLEVLVAADIVKTVALEPTFTSLGVLAGLVLVRTFLSWTLVLEIEKRWPWRSEGRGRAADVEPPRTGGDF